MRVLLRNKAIIFLLIISIILVSPVLIFKVNAQDGAGHAGLVLNPHKGHGGDTVQVSLDINTWVGTSGEKATKALYNGKTFSLVWDIGGWTNNEISAPWDTIQNTLRWEKIGSATWDTSGHLTGTATIPNRNEVGDHLLYAINELGLEGSMDFWWGFFEILPGGAVVLSPSPSPSPSPSRTPTWGDSCTLRLIYYADVLNVEMIPVPDSHSFTQVDKGDSNEWTVLNGYPFGSRVTLIANYTNDDKRISNPLTKVTITYPDGRIESDTSLTQEILVEGYTTVDYSTPSIGGGGSTGIPGFPFESIAIGLLLSLGLLYIAKKKSKPTFPFPK